MTNSEIRMQSAALAASNTAYATLVAARNDVDGVAMFNANVKPTTIRAGLVTTKTLASILGVRAVAFVVALQNFAAGKMPDGVTAVPATALPDGSKLSDYPPFLAMLLPYFTTEGLEASDPQFQGLLAVLAANGVLASADATSVGNVSTPISMSQFSDALNGVA